MTQRKRESYDPPNGYLTEVQAGWPTLLTSLNHPKKPSVPDTDYAGGRIPASFELAIISGPVDAPDSWMVMLMFTVPKGEIKLFNIFAVNIEADAGMKTVTQIRPLGWWKKFAVSEIYRMRLGLLETGGGEAERMLKEREGALQKPVTRSYNRLTDEKLREVAQVYRAAMSADENPTRAVESHFELTSYATAARWVAASRKTRGGLGPAIGKLKAGEQTDDEA